MCLFIRVCESPVANTDKVLPERERERAVDITCASGTWLRAGKGDSILRRQSSFCGESIKSHRDCAYMQCAIDLLIAESGVFGFAVSVFRTSPIATTLCTGRISSGTSESTTICIPRRKRKWGWCDSQVVCFASQLQPNQCLQVRYHSQFCRYPYTRF